MASDGACVKLVNGRPLIRRFEEIVEAVVSKSLIYINLISIRTSQHLIAGHPASMNHACNI
jgi:hypothetical protein